MDGAPGAVPEGYRWPRILVQLVVVSTVLTFASFLAPWWAPTAELHRYVEVTAEVNLPMWWTVTLLIAAGASMLLVAASASRQEALAWRLAAVIALLMSLDDATLLHEKLGMVVERLWPDLRMTFAWIVLGAPIALVVVLLAWLAGRRLPVVPGRLLLGGFALFLAAAVGFEVVGDLVLRLEDSVLPYRFLYHLEELLEMAGAALLCVSPLAALRRVGVLREERVRRRVPWERPPP